MVEEAKVCFDSSFLAEQWGIRQWASAFRNPARQLRLLFEKLALSLETDYRGYTIVLQRHWTCNAKKHAAQRVREMQGPAELHQMC